MRPFFTESVFWSSLIYWALRGLGLSRTRPFRVLVRAEPLTLKDAETGEKVSLGFFLTRVVMTDSEERAKAVALAHTRNDVRAMAGNAGSDVTVCEVDEANVIEGMVWRQPRGHSFFPRE